MVELAERFEFRWRAHLGLDGVKNLSRDLACGDTVGEGVVCERHALSPIALGKGEDGSLGPSLLRMVFLHCSVGWIIARASW